MAVFIKGDALGGYRDCKGLEVHLFAQDGSGEELAYPCGSWFRPSNGVYRVWIQGEWRMTPFSLQIGYEGVLSGALNLPVVDAGRVALPAEAEIGPGLELRLLHAGSYLEGEFQRWEMTAKKPAGKVGKGLLMPAGKAIAALWDPESRSYVALSRPFEVRPRKTVEAPLEQPAQGSSHLMVELRRLELPETVESDDVELSLHRGEGPAIPPDLEVSTADKVFAFWYGLESAPAVLQAETSHGFFKPRPIDLQSGRIEQVKARLSSTQDPDDAPARFTGCTADRSR